MTTDAEVLDVSWDWVTAVDVQGRFMQHAGPTVDTLSYGANCRQVRALGGDFYDFVPLPQNQVLKGICFASCKQV
jgi:serine phosphatase RsbU (regulator of sigma subunit)